MVTVAEGDEQAGAPLAPMAVPSPKRPLGEVNCAQPGNANAQPGEKRSRLSNSSNPPAGRVEVEVHALEKPAAATAAQQANGAKQPGGFNRLMGMGGAKSKRDDDFVAVAPADGGGAPPTKAPEPTPSAADARGSSSTHPLGARAARATKESERSTRSRDTLYCSRSYFSGARPSCSAETLNAIGNRKLKGSSGGLELYLDNALPFANSVQGGTVFADYYAIVAIRLTT